MARWKKKVAWLVVLAGALGLIALFAMRVQAARKTRAEAAKEKPAVSLRVRVARAERRDLDEVIAMTGTLKAEHAVDVFGKIPGRVQKLMVEVGQLVKEKQPLAIIERDEAMWQSRAASAQIGVAQSALGQATVAFEQANRHYERMKALRATESVSQAELDAAETAKRQAESAVRLAESQVKAARASSGLAGEAVSNGHVDSPIKGTIIKRFVSLGSQSNPGQPMFHIEDVSSLRMAASVTGPEFRHLVVGQIVELLVDDLRGETVPGKVATLSPSLDPLTRRAGVEITVDNQNGKLLPNMYATARVAIGKRAGVIVVPVQGVITRGTEKEVFRIKDGKAERVAVKTSVEDGKAVEILSGIEPGDTVVIDGYENLRNGVPVEVTP